MARAMEELELIADTYLSVSTPVQVAARIAARLRCRTCGSQILDRVRAQRRCASRSRGESPGDRGAARQMQAGRLSFACHRPGPRRTSRSPFSSEDDVLVHPGFFFDFATECYSDPEPSAGAGHVRRGRAPDPRARRWMIRSRSRFAQGRHAGRDRAAVLDPLPIELGNRRNSRSAAASRGGSRPAGSTSYSSCPSTRCRVARARPIRR